MSERTPAVIDDIDAAIDLLSDFGKSIVTPVARAIRESVILFAAVRGWQVVHHRSYVKWAETQASRDLIWLVLDPLFSATWLGANAQPVRFTRVFGPQGWEIDSGLPPGVQDLIRMSKVGVLDDVASNGRTFRHTTELVSKAGSAVLSFIVGASTARAQSSMGTVCPAAEWTQFLPGDHPTIHLRDGCPCLPFAGKRTRDTSPIVTAQGLIDVRVQPTAFRGGLWNQLMLDRSVQSSLVTARRSLVQCFSSALGRPATVGDVPLLGANVAIPLYTKRSATADTLLESILL